MVVLRLFDLWESQTSRPKDARNTWYIKAEFFISTFFKKMCDKKAYSSNLPDTLNRLQTLLNKFIFARERQELV